MKKAQSSRRRATAVGDDEPLPEYDFRGGVRGKYAAEYAKGTNLVLLDPDVADLFPDAASVNEALRALAAIARRHKGARARKGRVRQPVATGGRRRLTTAPRPAGK
jgi:hypothetical protein